jgi:hypothetical protein
VAETTEIAAVREKAREAVDAWTAAGLPRAEAVAKVRDVVAQGRRSTFKVLESE